MRKKIVFQALGLGTVAATIGLVLFLLDFTRNTLLIHPRLVAQKPHPITSTTGITLPPGKVAFNSNDRNTCPDILSNSENKYAELTKNRSKHDINYYYAKHKRDGEIDDTVVILTPISNSLDQLKSYFKNLCSLNYPHEKISVVLGEDSSDDEKTFKAAADAIELIRPFFRRVDVVHLHEQFDRGIASDRHEQSFQVKRRKHLAKSRNKLLHAGLRDEKWVLWMDVDLAYYPPDTIQQMISVQKHIVAPSCIYVKQNGKIDVYDRNTWKETKQSLEFQKDKPKNYVMLEGYSDSLRRFLLSYRTEGVPYVDIDGVGGAALLVYAECHRRGLIFPPFVYDHHLETEGLAKMAKEMGYEIVGLPFLEVIHS